MSDGRTAASRRIFGVVMNAILEVGKKKHSKTRPTLDWAPPDRLKKKEARPPRGQWERRKQRSGRPSVQRAPALAAAAEAGGA